MHNKRVKDTNKGYTGSVEDFEEVIQLEDMAGPSSGSRRSMQKRKISPKSKYDIFILPFFP